jgi:hypothetical protein
MILIKNLPSNQSCLTELSSSESKSVLGGLDSGLEDKLSGIAGLVSSGYLTAVPGGFELVGGQKISLSELLAF